jgi:hypothetical protein
VLDTVVDIAGVGAALLLAKVVDGHVIRMKRGPWGDKPEYEDLAAAAVAAAAAAAWLGWRPNAPPPAGARTSEGDRGWQAGWE